MIPSSKIGKIIAIIWLIACFMLLLFAYLQRDIHDMPIAVTWLMVFISAPVGLILAPVIGMGIYYFSEIFGLVYNPFLDVFLIWSVLVPAGYIQWFIIVPKLFRWGKSKWQGS